MSVPGDTIIQHFLVEDGGTPVTGLTTGSFTFSGFSGGSTATFTPTVGEIGLGFYSLTYTLPAATTEYSRYMVPVAGANEIIFPDIQGEIESTDLDVILASVVRPVATVSSTFTAVGTLLIPYVQGDTVSIVLTITDTSGNPVDIQNDWGSLGFGIRSDDGTTSVTEITTATAVIGVVTIPILAGDNFQTFLADGVDSVTMFWDFQATNNSTTKISTLARGNFILKRHEFRS